MSQGNVFGASMVRRNESPIGFHFDGEPIEKDWSPQSTESVWWLPRETASDYLILANASTQPLAGFLVVADAAGRSVRQPLKLGPAETQRLDLRAITAAARLTGTEGGVTVLVPSGGGNLITSHIVFDETTGMSATMKAFGRDPAEKPKTHTLRAPMLALVNPDPVLQFPSGTKLIPQVFLRNTTPAPLKVGASLNWRSASQGGSVPLPEMTLGPGATRVVSLADIAVPPGAYWATIVLNYQGHRADVVPIATSFDESGRIGLQTPFSETAAHLMKGSMWHVDSSRNSLITVGNGGSGPTRAALTLFYSHGKSSYTIERQLEPGEQILANVGDIIRGQIPDKNGKTIPPETMMGSYELRDLDHIGVGYLYAGKLIIDKSWGHGYYGCEVCCGYSQTKLLPYPFFSGGVGTGGDDTADGDDACAGSWVDVTSVADNWASTNSSVVKVANAYSHFMSPGSVTGSAEVALQRELIHSDCPVYDFEPQNTQQAEPTLSISDGFWYFGGGSVSGYPTNATVTANGASGGNFDWTITAGTTKASFSSSSNESSTSTDGNTVTVSSIGYSTGMGDVTISLTWTPEGDAAMAPVTLSTQIDSPYEQAMDPEDPVATPMTCSGNKNTGTGYVESYNYTVTSFFGTKLSGMPVNENFFVRDNVYSGNTWPSPSPTSYTTGTAGNTLARYGDELWACGYGNVTPTTTGPGSGTTLVFTLSRTWQAGDLAIGSGVTIQSDVMNYYTDHAGLTGVTSPAR